MEEVDRMVERRVDIDDGAWEDVTRLLATQRKHGLEFGAPSQSCSYDGFCGCAIVCVPFLPNFMVCGSARACS